jgi:hypothetical protein
MTSNQTVLQGYFDLVEADRVAMEARLDAALADTFPASDPVAITVCDPPYPSCDDGQRRAAGHSRR